MCADLTPCVARNCPICEGHAAWENYADQDGFRRSCVCCKKCDLKLDRPGQAVETVKIWNDRPADAQLRADRDALLEALGSAEPFVEDAANDCRDHPSEAAHVLDAIRAAIAQAQAKGGV